MKLKCCDCDAIFNEEDAGTYSESRGEFWGEPCYETMLCCPECRSTDFEECDEYEECWLTGNYEGAECYSCPHKEGCSGYEGNEDDE